MDNSNVKGEPWSVEAEADFLSSIIRQKNQSVRLKEWIQNEESTEKRTVLQTISYKEQLFRSCLTPFHWALFEQVDSEDIARMVDIGGIEMLEAVDSGFKSNSLIWAVTSRTPLEVVKKIVLKSGVELIKATNTDGNNALHMACRFSQAHEIIQFLVEKGEEDILMARNKFGELPLHMACKNHSDVRVIELLIDKTKPVSSSLRDLDSNGFSPLGHAFDSGGSKDIVTYLLDCFHDDMADKMLHKNAIAMLAWIKEQPYEEKNDFLRKPFVQRVLNKYFTNRLYLGILMLDFYAEAILVVIFSFGIRERHIQTSEALESTVFNFLILALGWRMLREAFQFYTTPVRDRLSNWVDEFLLILLVGSSIFLSKDRPLEYYEGVWICITTGAVWILFISVMSHLRFEVAVFVSAVKKVIIQLIPFLLTTLSIVCAFGNMLHIARFVEDRECVLPDDEESGLLEGWFCTLGGSYFTTFTMFLSTDWVYFNKPSLSLSTILAQLFALVIGILLLNILIAEIGNIYSEMRERGRLEFWSRRLSYVVEISLSFSGILTLKAKNLTKKPHDANTLKGNGRIVFSTISTWIYRELEEKDYVTEEETQFFLWFLKGKNIHKPSLLSRMKVFLSRASYDEIFYPGKTFEKVLSDNIHFSRIVLSTLYPIIPLVLTIQFLLGSVSFGYFWPYWMKKTLFAGPIDAMKDMDAMNDSGSATKVLELEKKVADIEDKLDRILRAVERLDTDGLSA